MTQPGPSLDLAAARRRKVQEPDRLVAFGNPIGAPEGAPEGLPALPLVATPAAAGVDLAAWLEASRPSVEQRLASAGAILFRGFGVEGVPAFERAARAVCRELFDENAEHQPTASSKFVQTPVFYAPHRKLLWHNENSFNQSWPSKIVFSCQVPAERGGETPLADSRRVFARLPPTLREPFLAKGVMYVRNYYPEMGLDWPAVFQTDDRAEVEAKCRAQGLELEWKPGGGLRTRAVRRAVIAHPATGEQSWFNQAQHWHVACLDAETRGSLEAMFGDEDMPRHCRYGDGSPIPDAVMAEILAVYEELETSFPWEKGDLLLVDNVAVAHARNPFVGERRILVALGDMMSTEGA
jgi:alpha-ketoglutarate-dependent taurine dioxygenase